MLALAQKSNWQAVAELEAERQPVITDLFQHPDIQQHLGELAETLRDVIELDRQCILLGEQERTQKSEELKTLQHGKRAVFAYLDNSH